MVEYHVQEKTTYTCSKRFDKNERFVTPTLYFMKLNDYLLHIIFINFLPWSEFSTIRTIANARILKTFNEIKRY